MTASRFRCMRAEFTLREFEAYKNGFWLMPTRWGQPETPLIADLKRSAGAAAVSILPWIGRIAASRKTQPWPISAEELGRICGVNPKSVGLARDVLREMGYVSTVVKPRHGARLLHWEVDSQLVAKVSTNEPYFYFSFRVLYGGHWSEMSSVQRAIYLAAGTRATVQRVAVSKSVVCQVIRPKVSLNDIEESRKVGGAAPNEYRLACVSYTDLARISGYETSTIKRAVQDFKHPSHWPDSGADADALTHCPLWVYPTWHGNALVYHFRDHVRPWPWAVENAEVDVRGAWQTPVQDPSGNETPNASHAPEFTGLPYMLGEPERFDVPKDQFRDFEEVDDLPF